MRICIIIVLSILIILSCNNNRYLNSGTTTTFRITFNNANHPISTIAILSIPKNHNPDTPAPLLIACHGHGSNAQAFHDLWKSVADSMHVILLVPQGEVNIGHPLSWSWGQNTKKIIFTSLDLASKRTFINPKKVYLTGFSMGGTICYELGLKNTQIFKGIAPICAKFEESLHLPDLSETSGFKVYIGHGEYDNNLQNAKDAYKRLSEYDIKVKLHIYDDMGHSIPEPKQKELRNILQYLTQ